MSSATSGFWEDGFRVTWAPSAAELSGAHALRAEVFCRELGWVGSPSHDLERDAFDAHCTSIVVVSPDDEVVATIRLVPGDQPWMFDEVFSALVPDPAALLRTGAVEASRLAVARDARRVRLRSGRRLADLLFKAAYVFCREEAIRHVYMLTSDTVGRRLTTTGIPCVPLAAPTQMPDGVVALPLALDWEHLRPDAPVRAWFEDRTLDAAPARLDAERARRAHVLPILPAAAQPWREQRLRASG